MTAKPSRAAWGAPWAPPLLVGAAAAISAEVAIGMLLYASPGFMRSLTTLLAVQGGALAAGLYAAPAAGPDLVDRLRRRWLFCLAVFLVAASYGTLWSLIETLGQGRVGQGFGLALLAGLPLFACGTLLGGMSAMAAGDKTAAPAALGAGLGFLATGALLPRAPIPASLLVGCLILLSGAGTIYAGMIGEGPPSPGASVADAVVAEPEAVAVSEGQSPPEP